MQNAEFSGNSLSARLFFPHFSHFSSETNNKVVFLFSATKVRKIYDIRKKKHSSRANYCFSNGQMHFFAVFFNFFAKKFGHIKKKQYLCTRF